MLKRLPALKRHAVFPLLLALLLLQACGGSDSGVSSAGPVDEQTPGNNDNGNDSSNNDNGQQGNGDTTPDAEKATVLVCNNPVGNIEQSQLNNAARADLLCLHNQTRSQTALGNFAGLYGNFSIATDMKRLRWDDKLEQVAQAWANQCQWMHNANRTTEYNALSPTDINGNAINGTVSVGENLAYKGSSNQTSANYQYAIDGYVAWEDEGQDWGWGNFMVNDFCDTTACGHFTQLIWGDTYKVGCAVNYCPSGTLSNVPTTYLVCNYASAGNYINNTPYQTTDTLDEVCSQADSGQTVCKNGLTESTTYTTGL